MRFRTAQGQFLHEEREAVDVLQGDGSAFGHSVQWVIRHVQEAWFSAKDACRVLATVRLLPRGKSQF